MLETKTATPEKGVSLFLSVIILSLLLAVALGISTILVSAVRTLSAVEYSVQAFFAADTGIERALFEQTSASGTLPATGAMYEVQFLSPGLDCQGVSYCIKSIGTFRESKRAVEIIR